MQTSVGEVLSLLPHDALSTPRYHDNHRSVTMETSPATLTSVTVTTQIEEAHSTTNNGCPSQPQSTEGEVDKKSIYRHPLFPLLALLLEKCEQATQTPDCPSADSFDVDIQAFVQRQEQERRAFFSDDLELDGLMVKAIQVLRIHLLELEKVSELCKDFCSRYISCLKGKLQSEQLLRTDAYDGEQSDDCLLSPGRSPAHNNNNNNNNLSLVLPGQPSTPAAQPIAGLGQGQVVSGGTVYQMVQTPQGLVAQPIQLPPGSQHPGGQSVSAPVVHGSTPLSQIGAQTTPDTSSTQDSPTTPSLPKDFFDDDSFGGRKSKRGVLPKQATQVMKSWLFQHIVHPYPTEDEKRQIAGQTNLTMLQVNNWFINARRRILQPMLDASNPEGPKAKKNKPTQNRPVQRFWPENLANLANMASANQGAGSPSQSPTSTLSPQTQLCVTLEEDEEEEDEDQEEEEDSSYDTSLMDSHLVSNYGQHLMMQTTGSVPTLLHPQLLQQPALLSDVASSASAQTLTLTSNVTLRAAEANVTAHSTNLAPLSTPEPGLQAPPPSAAPATDTLRI